VTVFGPKGLKEYIMISLSISQTYLKYPLKIVEIAEGVIFEDEQFIVEARLLEHGIPSYGYRIVEKDRPGTLLADKLVEAGVQPGPIFRKIKGGETVTLEDGTKGPYCHDSWRYKILRKCYFLSMGFGFINS
jgi:ribonuclease Z